MIRTALNFTACTIVAIAALCASRAAIADPKVYEPAGAPADPKIAVHWNRYHDYAQSTKLLKQLAETFPDLCRLQSLGKSDQDRELWLLTVTDFKSGDAEKKPAFWADGGIHANEIQATEVVLYTAWYLTEMFGRSPHVDELLRNRTFYLMPMMSPDSRDDHLYKPNTTHSPRTGLRPTDDDNDGLIDEDDAEDLDGDNQITQMRVRDPNGRWKSDPDYPQLMIRAKPDEKGEYTLLGSEGYDNDDDGEVNEDGEGEYDPNRNWAWNWQPDYVQRGADRYPFSLKITRPAADFVAAHPQIAGAQSFHNAGGMILRGPAVKADAYEREDDAYMIEIARHGEEMLPGYKSMRTGDELYECYGCEIDWFYKMRGTACYTNELFTPFNFFREKKPEGGFFGPAEQIHKFNKYMLLGDGVVKWHEVDHPQFGKVEVGGTAKNWVRQPPSFLLEEECHRNMAFVLYHADQLPQVKVDSISVKPLGQGIVEVTATIANERMTPTHLVQDVKAKITRPDHVTITGKELTVIAGFTSEDQFFTAAKEQKRTPVTLDVDTIPGMEARYVRWLVRGEGPFTITVDSVKGGVAKIESGAPK